MAPLLKRMLAPYLMSPVGDGTDAGGGTPAATPAPTPAPDPNADPDAEGKALSGASARLDAIRRITEKNLARDVQAHAEHGLAIEGLDDDTAGTPPPRHPHRRRPPRRRKPPTHRRRPRLHPPVTTSSRCRWARPSTSASWTTSPCA